MGNSIRLASQKLPLTISYNLPEFLTNYYFINKYLQCSSQNTLMNSIESIEPYHLNLQEQLKPDNSSLLFSQIIQKINTHRQQLTSITLNSEKKFPIKSTDLNDLMICIASCPNLFECTLEFSQNSLTPIDGKIIGTQLSRCQNLSKLSLSISGNKDIYNHMLLSLLKTLTTSNSSKSLQQNLTHFSINVSQTQIRAHNVGQLFNYIYNFESLTNLNINISETAFFESFSSSILASRGLRKTVTTFELNLGTMYKNRLHNIEHELTNVTNALLLCGDHLEHLILRLDRSVGNFSQESVIELVRAMTSFDSNDNSHDSSEITQNMSTMKKLNRFQLYLNSSEISDRIALKIGECFKKNKNLNLKNILVSFSYTEVSNPCLRQFAGLLFQNPSYDSIKMIVKNSRDENIFDVITAISHASSMNNLDLLIDLTHMRHFSFIDGMYSRDPNRTNRIEYSVILNQFLDSDAALMSNQLMNCLNLRYLSLRISCFDQFISEEGLPTLFKALQYCKNLVTLEIKFVCMDFDGNLFRNVAKDLAQCNKLLSLNLYFGGSAYCVGHSKVLKRNLFRGCNKLVVFSSPWFEK